MRREKGVVLVISLIMLLVLTLLGLAATRNTSLQQSMARNLRDHQRAFEAAEAALRDAQNYVAIAALPVFDNTNGLYQLPAVGDPSWWRTVDWSADASNTESVPYSGTLPNLNTQPRYIIEQLPPVAAPGQDLSQDQYGKVPPVQVYRITARGVAGDGAGQVLLQSNYRP
ncbi:MAG TPA: pilus assembly protein [Gammaproteobacteria bacterium]|nr:pilus assembly protein [Gammaproteobacteria bacterium]